MHAQHVLIQRNIWIKTHALWLIWLTDTVPDPNFKTNLPSVDGTTVLCMQATTVSRIEQHV